MLLFLKLLSSLFGFIILTEAEEKSVDTHVVDAEEDSGHDVRPAYHNLHDVVVEK